MYFNRFEIHSRHFIYLFIYLFLWFDFDVENMMKSREPKNTLRRKAQIEKQTSGEVGPRLLIIFDGLAKIESGLCPRCTESVRATCGHRCRG